MQDRFEIKTAHHVILDSVWFLTFVFDHKHGGVTILNYERDHMHLTPGMGKAKVIEGEGRIVHAIEYDGCTLEVVNPRHIFAYK